MSQTQKHRNNHQWLHLIHGTLLQASRCILMYLSQTQIYSSMEVYVMMSKHFADALYLPTPLPVISGTPQATSDQACSVAGRLRIRALPQIIPRFDIFHNNSNFHLTNGFEKEKVSFSRSAREQFDCVNTGIDVNAKVRFNVRSLVSWPENQLKTKHFFQHGQRYHRGQYRSFPGCIGKRLGVPTLKRSTRQKNCNLCPYSISNIIL